MSSGKTMSRIVTAAVSAMTAIAVSAVAVAGLAGWQPTAAAASPAPQGAMLFGVDQATAIVLGPAVPTQAKFEGAVAGALSSETSLTAPAEKRRASVTKTSAKSAPKEVVRRPVTKVTFGIAGVP